MLLGHQDTVVGYEDQFRMIREYPRSTFAMLDMASHNLQMEQPQLFASMVSNWLERSVFNG